MTWRKLAGVAAVAAGALVFGAILGPPGSGQASGTAQPTNTTLPTISGTPQEGQTLTASKGTWTGNPTSYGYAWNRCNSNGNSCSKIGGASADTYTLAKIDVGYTLRVTVTATNNDGPASATSAPTALVRAANGCPSGSGAIQIADLTPPARLLIQPLGITPAVVTRSTSSIQLHFKVTACGGRPVQGATVFAVPIPYNQFRGQQATTGADGTVTVTELRLWGFPASASRRRALLVVLARATKPGERILGGVSSRRAVSFRISLG